ncbi:MAG: hypothetical protein HN704_10970 [Bacteroidetes bacterium]|jgi:FKBP-type peptidyl-prolyl cis-trans isomerase|nr:hypothetical protein [Bacteroidota bacterium]MBT6687992.1 hypothetical protein [Bacteroidota bacterium]MBT7144943.1 hypothetical protein [Bacteroidota bacterium]MBT7492113.1 hypothetical protein [Bacteroidota bacterium]
MKYILIIISFLSVLSIKSQSDFGQDFITTKSGLKYKITQSGSGEKPKIGDRVSIYSDIRLLDDDSIFESNRRYGAINFEIGKNQTIKGIDEAVLYMNQWGKATVIVPPELAYGNVPQANIPPNSTLIYYLELIKIVPIERIIRLLNVCGLDTLKTSTGLKYFIVEKGDGIYAKKGHKIKIHYTGYLLNGTTFFSSVEKGEPMEIILGETDIIKGLEEGIMLMTAGSKFRFLISPQLAYGKKQQGIIPPNSELIIDAELIEVSF